MVELIGTTEQISKAEQLINEVIAEMVLNIVLFISLELCTYIY